VEYPDLIRQLTAPGETDDLSAEDQDALGVLSWFWEHKAAFNTLHAQQPQTLAHAITDSPAGLPAWNAQLFNESLDEDFVPTNTMLYWLTGTAGTPIRLYYEHTRAPRPARPTTILYRFRTRCRVSELRFGALGEVRQDHGSCLSVCCI